MGWKPRIQSMDFLYKGKQFEWYKMALNIVSTPWFWMGGKEML
jgi:hypothetical protein